VPRTCTSGRGYGQLGVAGWPPRAAEQYSHDRGVGRVHPVEQLPASLALEDAAQHPGERRQSLEACGVAINGGSP
jgi:hypothetical protein